MFKFLLFVHITSAFIAIAAVIAYPVIMSRVRTVSEARFGLEMLDRFAILPKIGGTLLFVSGLGFGMYKTDLFHEFWYWISIVIFFVILLIFAVLLPVGMKHQRSLLAQTEGDELSNTFRQSRRRSLCLEGVANASVFLSILLMAFKPL